MRAARPLSAPGGRARAPAGAPATGALAFERRRTGAEAGFAESNASDEAMAIGEDAAERQGRRNAETDERPTKSVDVKSLSSRDDEESAVL